jgi:hypothetical protein
VQTDSTTKPAAPFTPHASLAALGAKLRALDLFDPVRQHVDLRQKHVLDSPTDKLFDAFVAILSGAHGICEINTRLRSDPALQRAFGRERCAEQSVVQDTLNAASDDNVLQMHLAFETILAQHSRAVRHKFEDELLVVDIDLTGLLCGRKAEGAKKGFYSGVERGKAGHVRGRQLGRVTAAQYHEILVDRLYPGNVSLETVVRELVLALEQALALTPEKRARTVIRLDSGGGGVPEINFLLERGYHVVAKARMPARAEHLASTVAEWFLDPLQPGRELGWVRVEADEYVRPVRLQAARGKDTKGAWWYGVNVTTLLPHQARAAAGALPKGLSSRREELVAYARAYDLRGGAIEIENKQDKQGLGIRRRQKKRFAAARMVTALNALAHNVLIWSRRWLSAEAPELGRLGLLRLVRDVLSVSGRLEFDEAGRLLCVRLNAAAPSATRLAAAFAAVLSRDGVKVEVSAM